MTEDVAVVGGGVIGLSLAWELASRGARVRLLERGTPGREASWAGAGILPPWPEDWPRDPEAAEALAAFHASSVSRQPIWAARLREATGIDNGYWPCGGLTLALPELGVSESSAEAALEPWRLRGASVQRLDPRTHADCRPLAAEIAAAWLVPEEAQLRNPWHVRALLAACRQSGVIFETETQVLGLEVEQGRIAAVTTTAGQRPVQRVVLCSGAWTRLVGQSAGVLVPVTPVLGQMVLLRQTSCSLNRVINVGHRYLVPRRDGRVLVGSTEEAQPDFKKHTTVAGVAGLLDLARRVVPALAEAEVEQCWSGLRPGTPDGLPFLGPWPEIDGVFVATGHYRSGLTLAPATAEVLADVVLGAAPRLDLSAFRPDRLLGLAHTSAGPNR